MAAANLAELGHIPILHRRVQNEPLVSAPGAGDGLVHQSDCTQYRAEFSPAALS
jgi:hypothetical protein